MLNDCLLLLLYLGRCVYVWVCAYVVCMYKIIPYDLLTSSLVNSEALIRLNRLGWATSAAQALVVSKSSDPKINWLENNVTCIYWFKLRRLWAHVTRLRVNIDCIATNTIVSQHPPLKIVCIEVSKRLWHTLSLAAAFNLVFGQSTLIFIYLRHIYIWLFCSSSRSALLWMYVYVFYAKSIFNLPAEHLCKYQILTTNTCWLGSPQPTPHLICSSAVAFTLNCNYVHVILFALYAAIYTLTHICTRVFMFFGKII